MYTLHLLHVSADVYNHHQTVVQVHKKKSVSGGALFLKYVPWAEHLCYNFNCLHQKREFISVNIRLQTGFRVFLSSRTRLELEFHPGPARKLSTDLYDIYHCRVYSE